MSATGRSEGIRHDGDFYETPDYATKSILPYLGITSNSRVLDPCAGEGAIIRTVHEVTGATTYGFDVRPAANPTIVLADAFKTDWGHPTHVVTNPPYEDDLPVKFIEQSIANEVPIVAMLLRLNWAGGAKRHDFRAAHPYDIFILEKRPEFCWTLTCKLKSCGWKKSIKPKTEYARHCEMCGGKISTTTTDATEYAFFVWGLTEGWHQRTI